MDNDKYIKVDGIWFRYIKPLHREGSICSICPFHRGICLNNPRIGDICRDIDLVGYIPTLKYRERGNKKEGLA